MLGSLVPDKQQLLMIITIYFNNEAAGALYCQTKGQKSAVKCCLCVSVFADIINDCIYDTYRAKKSYYSLDSILSYSYNYLHANLS